MKKIFVLALLVAIPLVSFGQGSWFKRGITVGLTGDLIDTISVNSDNVTFNSPSYTHILRPYTFGTGITNSANVVTLGGTLSASVTLSNTGTLYDFYIQTALDATPRSSRIALNDGELRLYGYTNSTYNSTAFSMLSLIGSTVSLEHSGVLVGNTLSVGSGGVTVTTELSGTGITYAADYSSGYTDRSVVDKAYVDSVSGSGGALYTAGSGLTLSNDTVFSLGGTLSSNMALGNGGVYDFEIGSYLTSSARSSKLYIQDGYTSLVGYDNATYTSTGSSSLTLVGTTVAMGYTGAISSRSLSISSTAMTVTDEIGSKGLVYAADYRAASTDRSLIDKAHIQSLIAAAGGVTAGMQDTINDLYAQVFEDTVDLGTVVRLLSDTVAMLQFAFTDSAEFIASRKYMLTQQVDSDTAYYTEFRVQVPTGSPNFAYNIYHAADGSAAGTKLFTSDVVVTGGDATSTGEIDTPDSPLVPKDHWIWIQFSALTAKPPTGAAFVGLGYEY